VTGLEGLKPLELANTIILSSHSEQQVTIPVERAAYSNLMKKLKGEQSG